VNLWIIFRDKGSGAPKKDSTALRKCAKRTQKNQFGEFKTDFSLNLGTLEIWCVKDVFLQKISLLEIQSFWFSQNAKNFFIVIWCGDCTFLVRPNHYTLFFCQTKNQNFLIFCYLLLKKNSTRPITTPHHTFRLQ
jgi:hypothetical protein